MLDESALTGESLPVLYRRGQQLRSGTVSSNTVHLRAIRPAAESAYAALVRLVREAETQRAPFVRMADRYAAVFLPLTAAAAGIAWAISADPVRALAVFVVATPCPLILAAPIALLSGVSRAAAAGVVVKGAGVVERLGRARTVLLDKTGTLTLGTPRVAGIAALDGLRPEEALRLAASLDQVSLHPFAASLVREAHERSLRLETPSEVSERPGQGIEGLVNEHRVAVGSAALLREFGYDGAFSAQADGEPRQAHALVGVDGRLVATIELSDPPREGACEITQRLHEAGVVLVAMLTGDRAAVAEEIGAQIGVDRIYAEQTPEDKLAVVKAIRETPGLGPLVMVGDGINDAPALALADVGIAMGSTAATASTETADAVVLVERIDRVVDAIRIGRRSLKIARQSVLVGIALSLGAMAVAGLGYLTPLAGALFQEAVDVAVILNALRALRG
jgi:heavy metal translocating P-type ATPase